MLLDSRCYSVFGLHATLVGVRPPSSIVWKSIYPLTETPLLKIILLLNQYENRSILGNIWKTNHKLHNTSRQGWDDRFDRVVIRLKGRWMCNPTTTRLRYCSIDRTAFKYFEAMKVIIALLLILSIAEAFVPAKFSAALVKAIQGWISVLCFTLRWF